MREGKFQGHPVAIKELYAQLMEPEEIEEFQKESSLLASLLAVRDRVVAFVEKHLLSSGAPIAAVLPGSEPGVLNMSWLSACAQRPCGSSPSPAASISSSLLEEDARIWPGS